MLDLSRQRLPVQTLYIPFGEHLHGTLHVNFDKVRNARPYLIANLPVRRNGGGNRDDPVAGKQLANESYPTDIFVAVLFAKAQAFAKLRSHHVPVQYFDFRSCLL